MSRGELEGPTVLLHGGTCRRDGNMGDALMLRTVVDRLVSLFPAIRMVVKPEVGSYADRARWGFHQLLWARNWSRLAGGPGRFFLHRYRHVFGIVDESELDFVIDFMGFRYGDIGLKQTELAAQETARWRKAGAKIVFLPQAFGPFGSPQIRHRMREVLEHASVVYARDRQSEQELRQIAGPGAHIRRAPDITIPLRPSKVPHNGGGDVLSIVPNLWMRERTPPEVAQRYLDFLVESSRIGQSRGLKTEIILHSAFQDEPLGQELQRRIGSDAEMVCESDPLALKGRLGTSRLVVGSRYHALVAALSQGVPGLGTSWSHKYAGLYADFESPELLMSPAEDFTGLKSRIDGILNDESTIRSRLNAASERLSAEVNRMWADVSDLLTANSGRAGVRA